MSRIGVLILCCALLVFGKTPRASAVDIVYPGASLGPDIFGNSQSLSPGLNINLDSNTVTVNGGTIPSDVYGGMAGIPSTVFNNQVFIRGGASVGSSTGAYANPLFSSAVRQDPYGGAAYATIGGSVYGGASGGGDVYFNRVTISDGAINGNVRGGFTFGGPGTVWSNRISVTGGTVSGEVDGGLSILGDSEFNSVTVSGGEIMLGVWGGTALTTGRAANNSVTVTGGVFHRGIFGAYSLDGAASNNQVKISGITNPASMAASEIYGAYGAGTGFVVANSVSLANSAGVMTGSILGAFAVHGSIATLNNVAIANSPNAAINGFIGGGYAPDGSTASGNSVTISQSAGFTANSIFGGYVANGAIVVDNKVAVADSAGFLVSGDLFGGFAGGGTTVERNSVSITNSAGAAMQNVYGGTTLTGAASGNSVTISGSDALRAAKIVGGETTSGNSVNGNEVSISASAGLAVTGDILGGHSNSGGMVNGNSVAISGAARLRANSLMGGLTASGDTASGNSVTFSDSEDAIIAAGIVGGSAGMGGADGNSVTISGADRLSALNVTGGNTVGGTSASNNDVTIADSVDLAIGGGIDGGVTGTGVADDNMVSISSAARLHAGRIVGGNSAGGSSASRNRVSLTGSTDVAVDGSIVGGLANSGAADDNILSIDGAARLRAGGVAGGSTTGGASASRNQVALSGSADAIVGGDIIGGRADNGVADDNTVNLANLTGFRAGAIIGGRSENGASASGNSVSIANLSNPMPLGSIIGGYANLGAANNNSVGIANVPGLRAGDIIGGQASSGIAATGNAVSLSNVPGFYVNLVSGGETPIADSKWGNTLNIVSSGGSAFGVRNFEHYSFYLPASLGNGQTLIDIRGGISTDMNGTSVAITGVGGGGEYLRPGDSVVLIGNAQGTPATVAATQVPKGAVLLYDFDVSTADGTLRASLKKDELNPSAPVLPIGPVAELIVLSHYAELIDGLAANRLPEPQERVRGPNVYARATGGKFSYDNKTSFDVDGVSLIAGLDWRLGGMVLGGFFETGYGNYDSIYHFAALPDVQGSGRSTYYGGGILGFVPLPASFYAEASARVGAIRTDFHSDNMHFLRRRVEFDMSHTYYGAHAGLGYLWNSGGGIGLDAYTKYLWVRQSGDTVTVLGDDLSIDAADSQRWRTGLRLSYAATPNLTPFIGAGFEYEFDSKVTAHVDRYSINAPGFQGGAGIGEAGLAYKSDKGYFAELNVKGFVGRREGVLGRILIGRDF